jgi:hypothetical protein
MNKTFTVMAFLVIVAATHHITLGLLGIPPMGPYHTTEVK